MIYGILLAGGTGERLGAGIPKQFVEVGGKPLICYTIEKMLAEPRIEKLYIALHRDWLDHTAQLICRYFSREDAARIVPTKGGDQRHSSIQRSLEAICAQNTVGAEDVAVVHEAARPFATTQMVSDCIDAALKYGAAACVQPSQDTIFVSESDGEYIDKVPNRSCMFYGQAPGAYNLALYLENEKALTPEQRQTVTSDVQVWTFLGKPVRAVAGSAENFKITTAKDFELAKMILEK